MPCSSDHLEPTNSEVELSKIRSIADEFRTGKLDRNHFSGMHPEVYNKRPPNKRQMDAETAKLCKKLSAMSTDQIRELSLEAQIWWRDHKEADEARIRKQGLFSVQISFEINAADYYGVKPTSASVKQLIRCCLQGGADFPERVSIEVTKQPVGVVIK